MLINRECAICNQPFEAGHTITRVEVVYRVGNAHTEATEFGRVAHYRCPTRGD